MAFSSQLGKSKQEVGGKKLRRLCQPCKTAEKTVQARFLCVDCSENMCTDCSVAHTRFSMTRNHKISDINGGIESGSDFIDESKRKVTLRLLASIKMEQGEDEVNEPLLSGLDFLSDGRLVAADNTNCKCLVFDKNLLRLGSLKFPKRILGIAAVSSDELVITSGSEKKAYFINVNSTGELSLERFRNVEYKYGSICMMGDNDMLAATFDDPQLARILSPRCEERELGLTFPPFENKIYESACAYIKSCNKIVLSNTTDNNISIYDLQSKQMLKVVSFDISSPTDVAVGPHDDIFVCSKDTESLAQISHRGDIVATHKLDLKHPYSIAISKDMQRLAVFNNTKGNALLQLYGMQMI